MKLDVAGTDQKTRPPQAALQGPGPTGETLTGGLDDPPLVAPTTKGFPTKPRKSGQTPKLRSAHYAMRKVRVKVGDDSDPMYSDLLPMAKRNNSHPLAPSSAPLVRRRHRWRALVLVGVAIAVIAVLIVALRRPASRTAASDNPRPNVLLVTLDTTRADHIGCYGYAGARTPTLDRLAAEGARFAQASSPTPITFTAHTSLLTALYPFEHGARGNGDFYLAARFDTLATTLGRAGYRTAAFVSAFVLDRR
jgi:hypothetical protein